MAHAPPSVLKGGCLCGAVGFTVTGSPLAVRACWCRVCPFMAAGNASISAFFRGEDLHVDGVVASHERRAASGAITRHRFCPRCGTQLFADEREASGFVAVRVGTLDVRDGLAPTSYIWTNSAPDWGHFDLPAVGNEIEQGQ